MLLPTEKELLAKAKTFDLPILEVIYNRYSSGLFRYGMRLLGDSSLAEDCVSETFSRFLKGLRMEQGPDDHLQAYLYRIAHNWITDYYRRQPPVTIELDESFHDAVNSFTEAQLERSLEREKVRHALRSLTPDQRQVIILHLMEGWDYEEVGRALDKTAGTVRALQFRAIQALRVILQVDLEEDNHDLKR